MATRTKGSRLLHDFLKTNGITAADAAKALGVNPSSVHYWLQGQVPRTRMQLVLARWTGGAVPVEAWMKGGGLDPEKVQPFEPAQKGTGTEGG